MGNIVLLDELTINQIAAGEVIERPASVIKEMIENSIDANATNITIEIKNGGISYIKVTDNGKGIAKDDLEIAFERHATSKIRSAEDLNTVTSMGFRGEALASVAAVANVEMISKTDAQDVGYKIVVEAGNVLEKEETACQTGTSITVRNLFFNTPVRYKFLKKDYTETGYIEDVVTRIALVNPHIAFKLINSGKTIIQTSGNGDLKSVIYSIYGKDIAEGVIEVNYKYEDINVIGVIGKPEIARSNRSNQLFFVNKRHIKDKTLSSATEQAYKGMIPLGKFGFVVLNLELNPSKVDVNVHPAKLEVRFEEENKVFQSVYHAIKDALLKSDLVSNTSKGKEEYNNDTVETFSTDINTVEKRGLFGWKKNKNISEYTNEESRIKTNMIEDVYNEKLNEKVSEIKQQETEKKDNLVDTSDVLLELKQMQEKIKKDLQNENSNKNNENTLYVNEPTSEIDQNSTDTKVFNSSTYTYFGKNKERVEELLRQLHPNLNKTPLSENVDFEKEQTQDADIQKQNIDIEKEQTQDVDIQKQNIDIEKEQTQDADSQKQNIDIEKEQTPDTDIQNQRDEYVNKSTIEEDDDDEIFKKFDIVDYDRKISKQDSPNEQQDVQEENISNQPVDTNQQFDQDNQLDKKFELEEQTEDEKFKLEEQTEEEKLEFKQMYEKLFGKSIVNTQEIENEQDNTKDENKLNAVDIVKDNISVFEDIEQYQKPMYKFIGIVFNTYIIVEIEKEMYIIDQHAAHERIMYEKVKKNYYSDEQKDSQMLLLPDIITLTHKEMEIAKENMSMFNQAGFYLEEFGENTLKLVGVPTVCIDLDTKELFLETLDEINTVARTAKQEKEEKFIATVACKAAVKANMALTVEEVDSLMSKLLQLPNPFTCPHGRPTAIKMTKYDIERKFARK